MSEEAPRGAALGCAVFAAIFVPLPFVAILISLATQPEPALFPLVVAFGAPLAALHVLALFLPFYLMLAAVTPVRWWAAAALGLVCGGIPALAFSGADPAISALFAASGLVGGIAFWLTLKSTFR
ncbi:MAG TPA: hypothetical protein VF655_02325 [Allosphingosinicella sp.]